MNHLKDWARQQGTLHMLTYADNYAIGYFKKQARRTHTHAHTQHTQHAHNTTHTTRTHTHARSLTRLLTQGFTLSVTLAKKYWQGYIKDYEGASPMECVVHPGVSYVDIPNIIRRQKEVPPPARVVSCRAVCGVCRAVR